MTLRQRVSWNTITSISQRPHNGAPQPAFAPGAGVTNRNDIGYCSHLQIDTIGDEAFYTHKGGPVLAGGADSPDARMIQAYVGVHPPSRVGVVPN